MYRVLLDGFPGAFRVMTIETDRAAQHEAMPGRGSIVNLMASDTGDVASVQNNVAGVAQDMTIARVQIGVIHLREIDLEVFKQVVARHEVVRVRKAARFGFASAQMALSADGNDLPGIARMGLREPHQRDIVGMILRRHAMAGIAIERCCREGVRTRVDSGRVTARATQRESVPIPSFAISRKQVELSVAVRFQPALGRMRAENERGIWRKVLAVSRVNGTGVRILLPRIGYLDAMTEQTLVAGHILRDRLADVSLGE